MGSQMAYMCFRIQRDFYVLLYLCVYWKVTSVLLTSCTLHCPFRALLLNFYNFNQQIQAVVIYITIIFKKKKH